ncbi:MAG: 2,4-dihydroxyhept-2-ene-1,7-dioic acid aldolase [Alphaproteobacteria bacterium]|nr:2,4-dihydroxyhept-2-ene-1,7-dioic acid aldolase [Alphaproteobacteria bacterium]
MRENKLRTLWSEGKGALNCWLNMDSSLAAEAMLGCDWDSFTIDMQHSLIDWRSALTMLQTLSQGDAPILMRVPWLDPAWIMRALDAGVYGVICPMVNNRADCEAFVGACRYAPTGYRSWGPVRGLSYGGPDYFHKANETIIAMAMIETREALNNLDDIMSTPGLDGIYIGPNDLSISLGYEPQFMPKDPEVADALKRILESALSHNVTPGIHCGSAEMAATMTEMGFRFTTITAASRLMVAGANDAIETARSMIGN